MSAAEPTIAAQSTLPARAPEMPSLCFVAHNAYGQLSGRDTGHSGGIERQQSMMARWLAQHGFSVSMVTWDHGQPDSEVHHGVRVYKLCAKDAGAPILRFIHPRWTSLRAALRRANADVYYYNLGDMGLGQVVHWCRAQDKRVVYSVASEPDCDPRLPSLRPLRERVLYRYGLRRVDAIVVQTARQQTMLRQGFNREARVLPMPCAFEIPPAAAQRRLNPSGSMRVLWVGRFSREKRLEWLLEIASGHPNIKIEIVGASNTQSEYALDLQERAAAIPNVTLHGRLPHAELPPIYDRADLLCCTSAYEGFPNSFLEAWSRGTPVLTSFDPDGLVEREKLGWTAGSIEQFSAALTQIAASPQEWQARSERGVHYYRENHELDRAMTRFADLFCEIGRA